MKDKIYLRIAKTAKGYKYHVDKKRNYSALGTLNYTPKYFPTITICLNIDIPNHMFEKARAELDLKIKEMDIASDVKVVQRDPHENKEEDKE